jgi:putative tryptophan/tyrosine transport system substrate-binding protein
VRSARTSKDEECRIARYLARIFEGARAGDLPIEMPTHFELAINFRTAKALGLIVPSRGLLDQFAGAER